MNGGNLWNVLLAPKSCNLLYLRSMKFESYTIVFLLKRRQWKIITKFELKGITHDTLDSEKFIVFRASQIACVESGETMRESLIMKICRYKRSHSSSPQTERGKRLLIQFRNINAFLSSTLQPQASWKSNTLVWVAAFFPTLCLLICDEHSTLWSQFCISTNNVYIIFCCRKVTSRNNP